MMMMVMMMIVTVSVGGPQQTENVETTDEAETVTAVSQQTSEFDEDEVTDEVTPVTDSQTQTGISVQSTVQQLGSIASSSRLVCTMSKYVSMTIS